MERRNEGGKEERRKEGKRGRGKTGREGIGKEGKKQIFSLLGAPILLKHNYLLLWGEHGLASSLSY